MNTQEINWIQLKYIQEYNDIMEDGLTFATKQELQDYLDTLYFYEGEADGEVPATVPTDYTDAVWNIIQAQHKETQQ